MPHFAQSWGGARQTLPVTCSPAKTKSCSQAHREPPATTPGGSGDRGQGSPSEVAAWPQPFPRPSRLRTCLQPTLPCTFLFLNKHAPGSSQSLSFLLVAKARMGVEQRVLVIRAGVQDTTPSSGVWCQHYGTKPPADGETVQPEVSRDLLKATGWLPPHELLRRLGCWPQEEGWPWEQRQGSGALVEGDCSTWARGPQPPPFTLPSSSHPHT